MGEAGDGEKLLMSTEELYWKTSDAQDPAQVSEAQSRVRMSKALSRAQMSNADDSDGGLRMWIEAVCWNESSSYI